ncbi:MAG: ABC transporter substrate binding protein [Armatimonadota bacterium]
MPLIAKLALKQRLPSFFFFRDGVEAGGLASNGTDVKDPPRDAATFVDKILRGAKPADLPIEQPTRFYLAINLKTAKALAGGAVAGGSRHRVISTRGIRRLCD